MEKQNIRIFFILAIGVVALSLMQAWQATKITEQTTTPKPAVVKSDSVDTDLPSVTIKPEKNKSYDILPAENKLPKNRIINVTTDVMDIKIDLRGGDIIGLALLDYPTELKGNEGYKLLDVSDDKLYVAQSALLSDVGPDSAILGKAIYRVSSNTKFPEKDNNIIVDLNHRTASGIDVIKRFTIPKNDYLINVEYIVNNNSTDVYSAKLFGRLKRNRVEQKSGFMGAMRTYTGIAVNTPDENYKKITFDDISKAITKGKMLDGWIAMVEHYFTSAWIPTPGIEYDYQSEKLVDAGRELYGIRFVSSEFRVQPGESKVIGAKLYAGPEITDNLSAISKGLELTVDYGILWWLCQPIFWVLKNIHKFVGNWGVAIILTTLVIKLLFYRLSAASYRSMGNMRKLQPKIEELKAKHGDDKQAFGQAMMALYKREKVNPLGGCLPILVQIPVFIALYYVLLESVELRHAPFMFWLQDLSAKDPYYVLPLIMGATMFLQQKMNPTPPDPVQAKVMMFMPVLFTFLFLQFPSGLVLYWVVNNILSMTQQWYITSKIVKD